MSLQGLEENFPPTAPHPMCKEISYKGEREISLQPHMHARKFPWVWFPWWWWLRHAARFLLENMVHSVSGGCKLDPKFAVQSFRPWSCAFSTDFNCLRGGGVTSKWKLAGDPHPLVMGLQTRTQTCFIFLWIAVLDTPHGLRSRAWRQGRCWNWSCLSVAASSSACRCPWLEQWSSALYPNCSKGPHKFVTTLAWGTPSDFLRLNFSIGFLTSDFKHDVWNWKRQLQRQK